MNGVADSAEDVSAIYVDLGTTNTRVWLLRGRKLLAQASKQVGVRDSARNGTTTVIRATLKELIANVQKHAGQISEANAPVCVLAAGMIGSPLGLAEVPHINAPAGSRELSSAVSVFSFPDVTTLPFLIVPGVRSGSLAGDTGSRVELDVMRGEETLCIGLQALGLVPPPAVVLTLGSHWKAIQLSAVGQIKSSVTSLAGEMIETARNHTVLASSLGHDWPVEFVPEWLEAGMAEQRRSGLPRALFCVRLLELKNEGTPAERFSYLLGAFIAADLDALVKRGLLTGNIPSIISGHPAIAAAWGHALGKLPMDSNVLTGAETEQAFLAGLNQILSGAVAASGSTKAQQ